VREVTKAFLQHSNEERPHQGRSCGNVPPRVAFPTLPTLPTLPERVDPDAWLTPLDRKMYLRHVGRDGCVDVDLSTSYIGPQVAGRTVLLQVVAENHQFAVWHQDQVVKLLPIKGLVGQEMPLSDYLKSIQQEALAAPRRSSARRPRKVRQPPLWSEEACLPAFLLHPPAFTGACLALWQGRDKRYLPVGQRREGTRNHLLRGSSRV
jgi:hypothetical protein